MEMIIVKSKVKEVVSGVNVAGDFAEELNKIAVKEVKNSAKRAKANNRKTLQGKDVYIGKTEAKTMVIVKSKLKNIVEKYNVGSDFPEALNEVVVNRVLQASERAKANGRKTVSAKDL